MSDEILELLVFPEHRMLCFGLLSDVTRGEVICELEARGATLQEIADHFRLSVRRVHSLKALGLLEPGVRKLFLEFRLSETRMRYLLSLRQDCRAFDLEALLRLAIRYRATGSEIRAWAQQLRQNRRENPEQALRRISGGWLGQKTPLPKSRPYRRGAGVRPAEAPGVRRSASRSLG